MSGSVNAQQLRDDIVALLPSLRRFALSLTGSVTDADDLLHSTVERALARAEQFSAGTDVDRWLYRICRNIWYDEWRRRKVRGPSIDPHDVSAEMQSGGEEEAHDRIRLNEVLAAMRQLQEDQRQILELIVVEGYAYKEVAEMLDVPIGTVMSRLARARSKLATLLEKPAGPKQRDSAIVGGKK